MKRLWAPWRLQYIENSADKKDGDCPLCSIPASEPPADKSPATIPDAPASTLLLYKGHFVSVIMNRYPYSNGHLMVSPLAHTANLDSLSAESSAELFAMIKTSVNILKKSLNPEGLNIGMNLGKAAGAGIDEHMHTHIVPRWSGDSNFMPVISEVRVMPEHLQTTYSKLKPLFELL